MTIKEARLQAGLSRMEVYDIFKISPHTLQNWETNACKCPKWCEDMIIRDFLRVKEERENNVK